MNTMQTLNTVVTMSSREIAELCVKQHKHVLEDIRNTLKTLGIDSAEFSAQYKDSTGRMLPCFNLPKRETLILVSGYSVELRAKIIDRWQELETNPLNQLQPLPLTPHDLATRQLKNEMEVAALFECPMHIIQQEIVKSVRKITSIDFSHLLKHAKAQQNILPTEVMLEPTELGLQLNLGSGRAMNRVLESLGLQRKVNDQWIPTDRGEVLSTQHAWTSGNKTGYNLKWNLNAVKELLNNDL